MARQLPDAAACLHAQHTDIHVTGQIHGQKRRQPDLIGTACLPDDTDKSVPLGIPVILPAVSPPLHHNLQLIIVPEEVFCYTEALIQLITGDADSPAQVHVNFQAELCKKGPGAV